MISILLMFTRVKRDGIYDLHLFSFRCMGIDRWEPIYMHQLPTKVLEEFRKGDFVVKWSTADFNQVSPDQLTSQGIF